MAEAYKTGNLADVSWRDMLAQDPYFGLSNSFQYSENINCDDELHGIKLSQRVMKIDQWENSQLITAGERVFIVPQIAGEKVKYIDKADDPNQDDAIDDSRFPWTAPEDTSIVIPTGTTVGEAVVFQDYVWIPISDNTNNQSYFIKINVYNENDMQTYSPIYDHIEDSDESIWNISTLGVTTKFWVMKAGINQVLNFNNTRLVCGVGEDLRVYYPELDATWEQQRDAVTQTMRAVVKWETGWKKVQYFEAGCKIVWLTCDFEYLKVRVTDEGRDTKMYYYPGNNDLRNTFVYNIVDMTGTKVLRTYNINGVDYFTASLDGSAWYITFNKVIGWTPVQLLTQRWWLSKYDANQKAGYFIWPTTWESKYLDWNFYVGDAYGVFKFKYNPGWYDTGYLKWKIRDTGEVTVGLCIAWNFVFISDEHGIKAMRLYDTGIDGYEKKGILISREMEGDYGGTISKMIDEIRLHFELNPLIASSQNAWDIDVYLSPNNSWKNVDPEIDDTGRWHVIHIDWDSTKQNRSTRYEKISALNKLDGWSPAFEFDRETITYCVVIKRWTLPDEGIAQWTPIVREVNLIYHTKEKTNNILELKN